MISYHENQFNTHSNEIHYKCLLDEDMRHILLMTPIKARHQSPGLDPGMPQSPVLFPRRDHHQASWASVMCHELGASHHHNLPRSDPITAQAPSANHVSSVCNVVWEI